MVIRESFDITGIDSSRLYYNPGCALSVYKPEVPGQIFDILKAHLPGIHLHNICCQHDPKLPEGSIIIQNCAGCDRRFRSMYPGIETISLFEVLDSFDDLVLPDYHGAKISVHDSCSYRHKPAVHKAIRSLLAKMNLQVEEAEFHGTSSVCCGDNLYGHIPNEEVEARIQKRADQMPCQDVAVYCIGCVRAMEAGGKTPHHMADLLLMRESEPMPDTLDEYHNRMAAYIAEH